MEKNLTGDCITIGVVGLGLMGSSVVVSLLFAGHKVIAISPLPNEEKVALSRISDQLLRCADVGFVTKSRDSYLTSLTISNDYSNLKDCSLILECVIEKIEIKEAVLNKINAAAGADTIIASNTSAIPISILQRYVTNPERFIGIHWAEPAFATRFMEITCGDTTSVQTAEWVFDLAHHWGKEPTLLRRDIRGFITNRLMYAVYRESLSIVESGKATIEDVDKAFRYDTGSWMTLMGIFRRMDFLGLKNYSVIFNAIFSDLSNNDGVPSLMKELVNMNANGIQNCRGFYIYTEQEAKKWNDAFASFNHDIYQLSLLYPSDEKRHSLHQITKIIA